MKKEARVNNIIIPFTTNFIAVVLGIVISFAVQGIIDKKDENDSILSELKLVKKELVSNIADLQYAQSDMEAVSYSAEYLYNHPENSCNADSVKIHLETLQAESYLTLPNDALQMLKSTYLYSSLLDRELSLSIVRAYDICDALVRSVNKTSEHRINTIEKIDDFFMLQSSGGKKPVGIQTWISSPQGQKLLLETAKQNGAWINYAIKDIEETLSLIDNYIDG